MSQSPLDSSGRGMFRMTQSSESQVGPYTVDEILILSKSLSIPASGATLFGCKKYVGKSRPS